MLTEIQSLNFRNLDAAKVLVAASNVIILGENGQGKTNFLESVYYSCFASSFRERKEEYICRFDRTEFSVIGRHRIDGLTEKVSISWERAVGKRAKIADERVSDRKELAVKFPCVAFSVDDMELNSGSQERRRRFFDQTIGLKIPAYIDLLRKYDKIIKHKNSALKSGSTKTLQAINETMAPIALSICRLRSDGVPRFDRYFSDVVESMARLDIHCAYKPVLKPDTLEGILEFLQLHMSQEIERGVALFGPHRDRYQFVQDGREIAPFLSTGKKRLVAIGAKIAAVRFFTAAGTAKPIIIVDDVLSEVDKPSRALVVANLPECEQAFFSFLPGDIPEGLESRSATGHMLAGKVEF